MTYKEMIKHIFQLIFCYPILGFALIMIYLDSAHYIDVEKFGYAFFGGIVIYILNYFMRKGIQPDKKE